MNSISTVEQWLTHTTGGHPVLVPVLILAGTLIFLVLVVDFILRSILHPVLEKLGLRKRRRLFESLPATTSTVSDPDGQIVAASSSGHCFLTLFPGRSKRGQLPHKPFGRAYQVQSDGQIRELWRVEGWYSTRECFLSDNGRYLVRIIDSPGASYSKDLAIAFYDRGDLVRQLSAFDLVTGDANGLAFDLSDDNTFRMMTGDGDIYSFDVTTGEIISTDVRSEPHGARRRKAMFVAGACVAAVASVGAFLALSRRRLE